MIYLIGGSPRCGKTKVAKNLTQKTHIPWFPADYLGAAVTQYIPEFERPSKFPLREIRKQNTTTDFLYANYSPEQIVDFYHIQAETVWLGLKAFIAYAAHDSQDFIIEGYQITPGLLSQVEADLQVRIRAAFLYKEDEADIAAGIKKNMDPGDWLLKNTSDEATFEKVAQMVSIFGTQTKADAERLSMSVFNMDGDFDKKVEEVSLGRLAGEVAEDADDERELLQLDGAPYLHVVRDLDPRRADPLELLLDAFFLHHGRSSLTAFRRLLRRVSCSFTWIHSLGGRIPRTSLIWSRTVVSLITSRSQLSSGIWPHVIAL